MSSPHSSAVETPQPMPGELNWEMPTRLWPFSAGLAAFLAPLVALPMIIMYVVPGWRDPDDIRLATIVSVSVWTIPYLVTLWMLRGPDLGFDDNGLWLRTSVWHRHGHFVPWSEVRHAELAPRRASVRRGVGQFHFHVGAVLRIHTSKGPLTKRHRFIPCRKSGYDTLVERLEDSGCEVREPLWLVRYSWQIFGLALGIVLLALAAFAVVTMFQFDGIDTPSDVTDWGN